MEEIRYDTDGYEEVTKAIRAMLNSYPALEEGETFKFNELGEGSGKAMFVDSGAAIYQEYESITAHVYQMCQYSFTVVYRASKLTQNRKVNVKEWLDKLGRWLKKQPVTINGVVYKINNYPKLSEGRYIREVVQETPAYMMPPNEDQSEDWVLSIAVRYRNEFDM